MKKAIQLPSPPRMSERKRASVPDSSKPEASAPESSKPETRAQVEAETTRPSLSKRLPGMSDYKLTAYQASANRISRDPEHPKNASATKAIPLIEAEIRRRAEALGANPASARTAAPRAITPQPKGAKVRSGHDK